MESRTPIELGETAADFSGGTPLIVRASDRIQTVTLEDCMTLAAESSPLARAIDNERRQMYDLEVVPRCLPEILDLLAQHERNEAASRAAEAFFKLATIYLQHDIVLESRTELEEVSRIVTKAKEANLPFQFDERSLARRQNDLEEKVSHSQYGQESLSVALGLLMDVKRSSLAIWTDWQLNGSGDTIELDSALETAWSNRRDLMALEMLIECCDANSMDMILASARSLNPLLGLSFAETRRPLALFLQGDKDGESCRKAVHIRSLIEVRRKLIALKITELVFSIQRHARLIDLKGKTLASYQASLDEAEKGAAVRPVDLTTQLQNKVEMLQVKADIIKEIVEMKSQSIKLKHAQGLLFR